MDATRLVGADVESRDGRRLGRCVDLLIDVAARRVVYVLLDLDGEGGEALLGRDHLTLSGAKFVSDTTPDQIATREIGAEHEDPPPLDLRDMPPLVVGPFGYTFAPAMAGALFNSIGDSDEDSQHLARPKIDRDEDDWHWFSHIQGLPVFEVTRELGAVRDIVVNPEGLTCLTLKTETDRGELQQFDFADIRYVTQGEDSVVMGRKGRAFRLIGSKNEPADR